jgi:non-ribosomal peptide synthetase-like protein
MPKETPPCWSAKTLPLFVLGSLLLPVLEEGPVFPGLFFICYMNWDDPWKNYLLAPPIIAISFIALVCLQTAILKRLVLPRLGEGRYPVNSVFYVRHWFFSNVFQSSLELIGTVYSTLYLRYWFKVLGTKLGAGTEVSTARQLQPDLLDIGDGCFLADDVMVGAPQIANGHFTVGKVHVGPKTFLGNSALIPPGSVIGGGCLIGCLSTPPGNGQTPDGTSWFGSPAIYLPNRQKVGSFEEEATFKPSKWLVAQRYFIEAFRVALPNTLFIAMAIAIIDFAADIEKSSAICAALFLPFACICAAAAGFCVCSSDLEVAARRPLQGGEPSALVRLRMAHGAHNGSLRKLRLPLPPRHAQGDPLHRLAFAPHGHDDRQALLHQLNMVYGDGPHKGGRRRRPQRGRQPPDAPFRGSRHEAGLGLHRRQGLIGSKAFISTTPR